MPTESRLKRFVVFLSLSAFSLKGQICPCVCVAEYPERNWNTEHKHTHLHFTRTGSMQSHTSWSRSLMAISEAVVWTGTTLCFLQAIDLCVVSAILSMCSDSKPYFLFCVFLVAGCFDGRHSGVGVAGGSGGGWAAEASGGASSGSGGLKKTEKVEMSGCPLVDYVAQIMRVSSWPVICCVDGRAAGLGAHWLRAARLLVWWSSLLGSLPQLSHYLLL